MATPEIIAQSKIYPCLWFSGQDVHEVAKLYTSIFPDSRILRTVTLKDEHQDDTPGCVTVVDITLFGTYFQLLQAEAENVGFSDAVSLMLSCRDQEALKGYRNALIEAGREYTLADWIIDPFGLRWHTYPTINKESSVCPCIWHTGAHAKEMAEFYTAIFPDSNIAYATPPHDHLTEDPPYATLAEFTLFGRPFSVMQADARLEFNDAFSLVVACDDQQELDRYWNAFLEAGGVPTACGWLTDHFGFRWQIVPAMLDALLTDEDPERVKRVRQTVLTMEKLEIGPLEEAAKG